VPTLADKFRPRGNAFNVLRLIFAASVIVWHCFSIGGFRLPHRLAFLEDIGVDCFFIISGFLITRSWDRGRSTIRFLWHRFLRILPGFWVCLLVAIAVGAIAWAHDRGRLAGYWGARNGPLDYILSNWHLSIGQFKISGTPAHVPFPYAWDIPLWTLHWEFKCYLAILLLGILGLVRRGRRIVLAVVFLVSYALLLAAHFDPGFQNHLPSLVRGSGLRFASTFGAGAVLYLYADRIPVHRNIVIAAAIVAVASLASIADYRIVAVIPLAYFVVWLGGCNNGVRLTNKHDISYGVYIYGYITQQMLAVYGVYKLGYFPFAILSLLATVPLAVASWFAIEHPALRLKNWTPRRGIAKDPSIPEAAQ
jgi:peptidoglycan/LPS O-acetylase OafA/YrhL